MGAWDPLPAGASTLPCSPKEGEGPGASSPLQNNPLLAATSARTWGLSHPRPSRIQSLGAAAARRLSQELGASGLFGAVLGWQGLVLAAGRAGDVTLASSSQRNEATLSQKLPLPRPWGWQQLGCSHGCSVPGAQRGCRVPSGAAGMPTSTLRGGPLTPQAPGERLHRLYKQARCEFLLLESQQLPFLACTLLATAPRGRRQPWSSPGAELAGTDASRGDFLPLRMTTNSMSWLSLQRTALGWQ